MASPPCRRANSLMVPGAGPPQRPQPSTPQCPRQGHAGTGDPSGAAQAGLRAVPHRGNPGRVSSPAQTPKWVPLGPSASRTSESSGRATEGTSFPQDVSKGNSIHLGTLGRISATSPVFPLITSQDPQGPLGASSPCSSSSSY